MDEAPGEAPETRASRTPLGEPMDQASILLRAEHPLEWHLRYWLNLNVVGTIRGEDILLLCLRVRMEHDKIPDAAFKAQLQAEWRAFQNENKESYLRLWMQRTVRGEEAQPYHRDLDTMLQDKGRKMRDYLLRIEVVTINLLRTGNLVLARRSFERLGLYYQRLLQEEAEDAATTNGLPNGVHNEE